jgi:hypothetical protein
LVEREPSKLGVAGSSPVSRSKLRMADGEALARIPKLVNRAGGHRLICAQVAQSVEHVLGKDEVGGSSPLLGFLSGRSRVGVHTQSQVLVRNAFDRRIF